MEKWAEYSCDGTLSAWVVKCVQHVSIFMAELYRASTLLASSSDAIIVCDEERCWKIAPEAGSC